MSLRKKKVDLNDKLGGNKFEIEQKSIVKIFNNMSEEDFMSAAERKLGRISPDTCALLICDIQEKFRPAIYKFDHIVSNTKKLVEACNILKIPTFATEQYPKGLGSTVHELKIQDYGITPVAKTCFTMALPQIVDVLKSQHSKVSNIILCGVESHVCVLATCQSWVTMSTWLLIVAQVGTTLIGCLHMTD